MKINFVKTIKILTVCGIVSSCCDNAEGMRVIDHFSPRIFFDNSIEEVADYTKDPIGKPVPDVPMVAYHSFTFERHKAEIYILRQSFIWYVSALSQRVDIHPQYAYYLKGKLYELLTQEIYVELLNEGIDANNTSEYFAHLNNSSQLTEFEWRVLRKRKLASEIFYQNISFVFPQQEIDAKTQRVGGLLKKVLLLHLMIKHNIPGHVIPEPTEEGFNILNFFHKIESEFFTKSMQQIIAGNPLDSDHFKALCVFEGKELVEHMTSFLAKEHLIDIRDFYNVQFIAQAIDMLKFGKEITSQDKLRLEAACLLMIGLDLEGKKRLAEFRISPSDSEYIVQMFVMCFPDFIKEATLEDLRRAVSLSFREIPQDPAWSTGFRFSEGEDFWGIGDDLIDHF